MRISAAEVIPYSLPFREPYVTASGRLERREMALLRLRSEEGLVGLGEAVPLSLRGGASLEQVVRELEALSALSELVPASLETLELTAPARCAALTALGDLHERSGAAGPSAAAPPVPCNATLSAGPPTAVAEEALRWAAEGFSTFKLKVGTGDDLAQVRAVREALGPAPRIRLDANGSWSLEHGRGLLAELEPLDIELVEQPVGSMADAADLARSTSIPLAGDESIVSAEDAARARESGAFSLAGIKLPKVGGADLAAEVAAVLPSYVSSALDGPVGIAAAGSFAQTLQSAEPPHNPDLAHGLATQRLFASTIASVECELHDGKLHLPPGPGLGVEIDEEALRAHRL